MYAVSRMCFKTFLAREVRIGRALVLAGFSFRKIIYKLKAELMKNMCYHLNFMSRTEPYKVDNSYVDSLKCTVGAMWSLSS